MVKVINIGARGPGINSQAGQVTHSLLTPRHCCIAATMFLWNRVPEVLSRVAEMGSVTRYTCQRNATKYNEDLI